MVECFIAFTGSLEYIFEIREEVRYCAFAFFHVEEGEYEDDDFDEEYDDTDDDGERAKPVLLVIVPSPGDCPVDDPDQIDNKGHCDQVPESGFLFDV